MSRVEPQVAFSVLGALLFCSIFLGLILGPVPVPFPAVWKALLNHLPGVDLGAVESTYLSIVLSLRLPRVLSGLFVGASLAVSGTVMQGIFRNPLATPYVLGVASGGSAGAALVISLGLDGSYFLPAGAMIGAGIAVTAVYSIASQGGRTSTYTLILAGVALSALFSAVTTLLIFLASPFQQNRILFWLMGGLWRSDWGSLRVLAPVSTIGVGVLLLWSRELNALALGENTATHLGTRPEISKKILLGIATVITSTGVAVAGTISFVGLVVPHMLRILLGPDHRKLIIASALGGGLFLIDTDIISKLLVQPSELPVGVITAFFGVPFFLYLLRRVKVGRGVQ